MTQTSSPTVAHAGPVAQAADRLRRAAETRTPCDPVRNLIGRDDLDAAYAVQSRLLQARIDAGARVVGRKVGLTSKAVQAQLGVDRPDFGVLLDDMDLTGAAEVPMGRLLQPKVEAEVAFVLGADLAEGDLDDVQVRHAVDQVVAAIEVVDSRVAAWDISLGDTVADNASSGLYVLGPEQRTLAEVEPVEVTMTMRTNGEVTSTGDGSACLGDPLAALAWLARTAREHGQPLRAGQVVLSGALGPMAPVTAGDEVVADISGLGTVRARFSGSEEEQ